MIEFFGLHLVIESDQYLNISKKDKWKDGKSEKRIIKIIL